MCFFKIVDMLLLSKNIVLERDIVFEQNKKLSLLSLLSLTPSQASGVFSLLQALFLKTIETIETILGAKNVLL